jgi:hypothetical protein
MMQMRRRSFLWAFIGSLVAMCGIDGIGSALADTEDLRLVDGWIVRRSQLPKRNRKNAQ